MNNNTNVFINYRTTAALTAKTTTWRKQAEMGAANHSWHSERSADSEYRYK